MTNCEPLVTMSVLVELFPQYNSVSVYRWRSTKGKNRLPEPDLLVGHVPLWYVQTILDWAEGAGKELDQTVLARIVSAS